MHLVDGETRSTGGSFRSAAAREKKYISRMPVIVPREGIDQNMLIKAPDSSIDFKMIVKDPSVEDVK